MERKNLNCPQCLTDGIKTEMTEMRNLQNELIYVCPVNHYHFYCKRDLPYLKELEAMTADREMDKLYIANIKVKEQNKD